MESCSCCNSIFLLRVSCFVSVTVKISCLFFQIDNTDLVLFHSFLLYVIAIFHRLSFFILLLHIFLAFFKCAHSQIYPISFYLYFYWNCFYLFSPLTFNVFFVCCLFLCVYRNHLIIVYYFRYHTWVNGLCGCQFVFIISEDRYWFFASHSACFTLS